MPLEYTHRDPEIADALKAAARAESLIEEALLRLGPTNLDTIPNDFDSWSAVETIGHLLDVEIALGHHLRLVISQESPRLEHFDEEAFVIAQNWRTQDIPMLLEAWETLRRVHLALISRLDTDALARGGVHSTEGSITARDLVLKLPVHDRFHLSRLGRLEERLLRPLA